ncbi:lipoate--protein ligase [Lachnospiraceae bacterium ZAX-1]
MPTKQSAYDNVNCILYGWSTIMTIYTETGCPNATYNFAFEDYCIDSLCKGNKILSIWQADNTVMLGRYQIAQNEINDSKQSVIHPAIVRRSTGGGTIYTDVGTLLFTAIMPVHDVATIDFSLICKPFVHALQKLGLHASLSGRNDILIDGKKVSGNAQTVRNGYLCAHGSLLYHADLDTLSQILHPDKQKIESKAIKSIRFRVANLSDYMEHPPTIDVFKAMFKEALLSMEDNAQAYILTDIDRSRIVEIKERKYDSWEWTYGNAPTFNIEHSMRFPMGRLIARMNVNGGAINSIRLYGDFLGINDLSPLESSLTGIRYDKPSLRTAISKIDTYPYLRGIANEELIRCILGIG